VPDGAELDRLESENMRVLDDLAKGDRPSTELRTSLAAVEA